MNVVVRFNVTKENYTMTAEVRTVGPDLTITVTGGDNPHVGTITAITDGTDFQTIQYPSHDGRLHKDNFISERIARQIQHHLTGSATVMAGVHVNHITKKQIAAAAPMSDNLAKQINDWLQQHPIEVKQPIYYGKNEQPQ